MVPCSSGSADAKADKGSGTCSSVSLVLRCAPPQTARPATSIATLRCETVTEQVGHRLTAAPTLHWPTPPAPALLREKRCARLCRNKSATDLHPLIPPAPKGDNRPGGGVPARASVPRICNHNIIPSGLCNSRRQRQCPASRESVKHTPGARRTILQGVRLHNPDYVKFAPSVICKGRTPNLPGEAAADKRPPSRTSGLQARQGAAHFALLRISVSGCSSSAPPAVGKAASDFRFEARIKGRWYATAQSAGTCNVSASPPSVTRWQPQCCAGRSAALGASLGVGPAPPVVWQNESATPLPAPFLRGTAPPCSYLPAIPPGLASLRLRKCQVAFVQQSCPATSPLSCLQLAKPSGQPGHSRPLPLPAVGADSVGIPLRCIRHRLRSYARIKGVRLCFYSEGSACSRTPSYPARRSVLRSQW